MAEWQKVKKMLPYLKVIVFGSAGESLLHPHIEEILTDLQPHRNLFKVLTTNAMALSNDRLLRLVLASINRVGISLEGATARRMKNSARAPASSASSTTSTALTLSNPSSCKTVPRSSSKPFR